jgi:hypothetical protein
LLTLGPLELKRPSKEEGAVDCAVDGVVDGAVDFFGEVDRERQP